MSDHKVPSIVLKHYGDKIMQDKDKLMREVS